MFFRQNHGRIKANNRCTAGNRYDGLYDRFPHRRQKIIELRRIIPGDTGPVITMVDIADTTTGMLVMPKDHSRITAVPVAIFQLDCDGWIIGKIVTTEAVGGKG